MEALVGAQASIYLLMLEGTLVVWEVVRRGARSKKRRWTRRVSNALKTYTNTATDTARLAQAKHEAFLKARGRHYSNEAEAMKVSSVISRASFTELTVLSQMAQKLMEEEDDDVEEEANGAGDDDVSMEDDESPRVNGVAHGA